LWATQISAYLFKLQKKINNLIFSALIAPLFSEFSRGSVRRVLVLLKTKILPRQKEIGNQLSPPQNESSYTISERAKWAQGKNCFTFLNSDI